MIATPVAALAAAVRTGTAALAVAVALFLLLRIPLIATFRAALIVLAALEVLSFGRRALSRDWSAALWAEIAVKLAVLTVAYLAVSG
jgi:hypothetical protein